MPVIVSGAQSVSQSVGYVVTARLITLDRFHRFIIGHRGAQLGGRTLPTLLSLRPPDDLLHGGRPDFHAVMVVSAEPLPVTGLEKL